MNIGKSTFYYKIRDNLNKKRKEADIKNNIKTISYKHPYYGYRRMTAQLKREKLMINHKRVLRMNAGNGYTRPNKTQIYNYY